MTREQQLSEAREAIQYHADEINRIIDENTDPGSFPRSVQLEGTTDDGERVQLKKIRAPVTVWF